MANETSNNITPKNPTEMTRGEIEAEMATIQNNPSRNQDQVNRFYKLRDRLGELDKQQQDEAREVKRQEDRNRKIWIFKTAGLSLAGFVLFCSFMGGWYVVGPSERGVRVTLGNMSQQFLSPGIGLKWPFITTIYKISVKQDTKEMTSECFSLDLQEINIKLKVLYRIPEGSVVSVMRDYAGDPFDKLILPRVHEATKEVTALKTAADIVKTREQIKIKSLEQSRDKIGSLLILQDLVIEDVALSKELATAIEAKMVQQQQAERSLFVKQQAQVDAETAVIRANGEARAIKIQGEALKSTPQFIDLKTVERWNGVTPQVVTGNNGTSILLPMNKPTGLISTAEQQH